MEGYRHKEEKKKKKDPPPHKTSEKLKETWIMQQNFVKSGNKFFNWNSVIFILEVTNFYKKKKFEHVHTIKT